MLPGRRACWRTASTLRGRVHLRPERSINLAVFRIAVVALLLASNEWRNAVANARFPEALRVAPEGLAWALAIVPITPGVARVAQACFLMGATLALLGAYARVSLVVATLSGLYLFALPQLTGSVLHDMHLLWFAALLAASPCADALSVDAWTARKNGHPLPSAPSAAYAWPLVTARVLLGLVYFFPGFWKLASGGWAWIASDNLRNQMYWKWYEHDWVPAVRIDALPLVCRACALGVVLFELSFLPLAIWKRTRPVAAIGGIAFHVATQALMRIGFVGLWGCYVALVDWRWLAAREDAGEARKLGRAWWLGVAIVIAVFVQGARGAVQAWPFACYPTFQWLASDEIPDVVMTATYADGTSARVPQLPKSQAAWGTAWALTGARGTRPTDAALRAYWQSASRDPRVEAITHGAREIRFTRGWFSVLPADRGQPPRREDVLGSITLPP